MKLFISYARVDRYLVNQMVEILRDAGYEPWFDHRLLPGQDWKAELLRAVKICDAFLYALSPESVESEWCQWEFAQAVQLSKPIIPVLLQARTQLPDTISRLQYADFSEGPTPRSVARLMGGLRIIQVVTPSTQLTVVPNLPNGVPAQVEQEVYLREAKQKYAPIAELVKRERTHSIGCDEFAEFQKDFPDYDPENLTEVCRAAKPAKPARKPRIDSMDWLQGLASRQAIKDELPTFIPTNISHILPIPFEWCEIPSGETRISYGSFGSPELFFVEKFLISKYPITNAQYRVFLEAEDGYALADWWDYSPDALKWREKIVPSEDDTEVKDNLPKTNVNAYEALAFCNWLNAKLNEISQELSINQARVLLPTEQQWQRAAQGDTDRVYPWGNRFHRMRCNTKEGGINKITPVTFFNTGLSPYGVADMAGNVWEWSFNSKKEVESTWPFAFAVRGGSFDNQATFAKCTARNELAPHFKSYRHGFRVVYNL